MSTDSRRWVTKPKLPPKAVFGSNESRHWSARVRRSVVAGWSWLAIACAPQLPPSYLAHEAAAKAATARRDHTGAAAEWANAAAVAETDTDRQEALYRQATSAGRAGDTELQQRLLVELSQTPGPRRERAVYDLAQAELRRDPRAGGAAVRQALLTYSSSGLARGALDRWLELLTAQERVTELESLGTALTEPRLRERVLWLQARNLELCGHPDQALRVYKKQTQEYPYPYGQFWDESLLRQAVLLLRKGDGAQASALLQEMLSHREQSTIVGSYDRHYGHATLLLAYALLDSDWERAYGLLHTFPAHYPDSRDRDDALWAAIVLAGVHADQARACESVATLAAQVPDSRYVPCLKQHCDQATANGVCHAYIPRDRGTAGQSLELTLRDAFAMPLP